MGAEAQMVRAGIGAKATVVAAEEQAEAMKAAGSAAAKGGMMSAIGGIASMVSVISSTSKHTIDELEYACDVLRDKSVTFFYKDEYSANPERMHYGFIAQEFQGDA